MRTSGIHALRIQRGFALVLSLVIMSLMVLVVLCIAGFLRVETCLSVNRQAEISARLNAITSMRLAIGAVQQSLGSDTRISASALVYDDPLVSSTTTPGLDPYEYPVMGVWRSWEGLDHDTRSRSRYAGRPQAPDYTAKTKTYASATPTQGRFVCWLVSSPTGDGIAAGAVISATKPLSPVSVIKAAGTVPLIDAATALVPTQQVHLVPLSLGDGKSAPTVPAAGSFAWWVGGENQKVRIAFPATVVAATPRESSERLATFGKPDLVPLGFADPATPLTQLTTRRTIDLLALPADTSRLSKSLSTATPTALTRAGFHDITFIADGLLTNTATGGLRKDLSLFTETWDWMNDLDSSRAVALPLFRVKPATQRRTGTTVPDHDLAFLRSLPDAQFPSGGLGNRRRHGLLYWWADYGSEGGTEAGMGYGMASDGGTPFGGYWTLSTFPPIRSWAYLTDFALHYRRYAFSGDSAGLTNVIEMAPPTLATTDSANAGRFYGLYERMNRHPLIARYQFVFAGAAVGNNPAVLVQPVVTLWNPYNVKLTIPAFNTKAYPGYMPIAFEVADSLGGMPTQYRKFGEWISGGLNCQVGSGSLTFAPGQTRVFSIPATGAVPPAYARGVAVPQQVLAPGYVASGNAGIRLDFGVAALPTSSLSFRLVKALSAGTGDAFRNGIYFDWDPVNTEEAPVRYSFEGLTEVQFQELYGQNAVAPWAQSFTGLQAAPRAFGTFAFGARLSNDGIAQYSSRTGVKTVSKGFLQANPFTNYTELGRKSACLMTVFAWSSSDITSTINVPVGNQQQYSNSGFNAVNPSYFSAANTAFTYAGSLNLLNAPFDLDFRVVTAFGDTGVPQCDSASSEGYVVTGLDAATGLSKAVVAELPVRPIVSLAELQACDLRFTNPVPPYMTNLVGNADASPILPPNDVVGPWITQDKVTQPRDMIPPAHMQYDDSYCLNHALFDDWFFSSLAPRPADRASLRPATGFENKWNPDVLKSLKSAWAEFVAGTTPLPNTSYVSTSTASTFALDTTADPFGGTATPVLPIAYLRVAAHLRVKDQFNVNSVSVPAWRAILGNLRSATVPVLAPGSTSTTTANVNNPLMRMQVAPEIASTGGNASRAVIGFTALTDAQLDALAVAIVAQVRLRGPFLSLSEFINRRLAAADGTLTDPTLSGALGMALRTLEAVLAKPATDYGKTTSTIAAFNGTTLLGPGFDGKPLLALGDFTNALGEYAHPKAAEGNSNFGLPGWPRQADLLRSLAPIITVRDDTVVIRAYGAASIGLSGNAGRAWCEVVLVRTINYVDARIPAHEAPLGDALVAAGTTTGLANVTLGRRYKISSFRWLTPQEL